jgi:hypothetical protein
MTANRPSTALMTAFFVIAAALVTAAAAPLAQIASQIIA